MRVTFQICKLNSYMRFCRSNDFSFRQVVTHRSEEVGGGKGNPTPWALPRFFIIDLVMIREREARFKKWSCDIDQ